MKRSEFKKKLISVLESFYHKQDEAFDILTDFLLNEIEKAGMLPPEVDLINSNPESTSIYIKCNKWESEND